MNSPPRKPSKKFILISSHFPFVLDPLDSLRPGGPNARIGGNIWVAVRRRPRSRGNPRPALLRRISANSSGPHADFADAKEGRLPDGQDARTNGPTATSMPASAAPRSFSMKLSHAGHQPSDARNAQRHGLLAERQIYRLHGHAEHRADRPGHRAMDEYGPEQGRLHQRVHRRRLRQQNYRRDFHHYSRAAFEEGRRPSDDAHHAARKKLSSAAPAPACSAA